MNWNFYGLFGLVVVFGFLFIVMYNRLVRLRVRTEDGWSGIDVQLKRRYDLIPNLVETVKGYAAHERETLEAVIQARSGAIDASAVADQADSENMLSGALKRLFALSEAYPALKADSNFMELQKELVQTEGLIGYARGSYNESVLAFNNKGQVFPSNIIANMFNFVAGDFFEIEDEATGPVSVQF